MKSNKALAYSYEEVNPIIQDLKSGDIHTTLPMDDLISLFENEIREIVDYDSFEYEHSEKAIHVFRGSPKLHKCYYTIKGLEQELGRITLSRRSPFKEEEMIVVEKALGALSIHLNNAIGHQSELQKTEITDLVVEAHLTHMD